MKFISVKWNELDGFENPAIMQSRFTEPWDTQASRLETQERPANR